MESASSCSQIGSVASLELLNENATSLTTPVKDKKKSKKKKVTKIIILKKKQRLAIFESSKIKDQV